MGQTTEAMQHRGKQTFLCVSLPDDCVGDDQVDSSHPVTAEKLEHQHRAIYEQESGTTAAAEARVVHVVRGTTGSIEQVRAGCVVACIGDATVTVDLLVNGASVLTAAFDLSSSQSAYELVTGVIDDGDLEDGDVVEVSVTVNAGTGTLGEGVFAEVDVHEDHS